MSEALRVLVSLDVEEEGLFRGRYACRDLPLANLASLSRLEPFLSRGARPTLFCAYPVLANDEGKEHLAKLKDRVEIGAHMHHWNTPPLAENAKGAPFLTSVPASAVPLDIMEAKLQNALEAGRQFIGKPLSSFRMGRWDLKRDFLPALARNGISVDASVRPLHNLAPTGPDHFHAPADPYYIHTEAGNILEAPLTVTPLLQPLSKLPPALGRALRHWGALALLPVEHPLWLMRLTTLLHTRRGGKTISLTWHSSEMFPGGNPAMPTETAVNAFLAKISRYLDWLENSFNVEYLTMNELLQSITQAPSPHGAGDWISEAPSHA